MACVKQCSTGMNTHTTEIKTLRLIKVAVTAYVLGSCVTWFPPFLYLALPALRESAWRVFGF